MSAKPGQNRNGDKLADMGRRIAAARDAGKPKPRKSKDEYTAASYAWRMIIELVMGVMVGAAMGWGLDSLFGSLPVFLIVFVLLGFAAGVRTMMRSAREMQRRQDAPAHDEKEG